MKRFAAIIVLIAVVAGVGLGIRVARHLQSAMRNHTSAVMLPKSVAQLVGVSTVIFQGTVVGRTYTGVQDFGPVPSTRVVTSTPSAGTSAPARRLFPQFSVPITELSLRVDEIYYARPPVTLRIGDHLTMPVGIDPSTYATPTPGDPDAFLGGVDLRSTLVIPDDGDSRLFILSQNPDGRTFGTVFGPYDVLDLSGAAVKIGSSPPITIDITEHTDPPGFIAELRDAIGPR